MHYESTWKRDNYKTIRNYIERFKNDALEIALYEIDYKELLWHFWRGLSYFLQHEVQISQEIKGIEVVLGHVLKVADAFRITLEKIGMVKKIKTASLNTLQDN